MTAPAPSPPPAAPRPPFLDRARLGRIFGIALPIMGGMVSQNVLNLVDTAMVGTLGDAALAAVGMASFANFMCTAFITGMSAGVQAMAARRKGEGRDDETAVPLNGGLLLVALLALPLSALLIWQAPALFPLLNDDPEVVAIGVPYFQARMAAALFLGCNFAFRGYWNAVDLSRLYLRTLVLMHAVNIFLNFALIFGYFGFPELGAVGAGIGTSISIGLGTLYYVVLGLQHARGSGFLAGLPGIDTLRTMARLSVPAGLQQTFFAAGFTTLFWIVGQIGTAELAAANVLVNVNLVAILPSLGLGLAAASLVGQALGRHDVEDAWRWGWDVVKVGVIVVILLGAPMVLLPDLILGLFIQDPATVALGRAPLQLAGATLFVDALGLVLLNAIMGAGATRTTLAVSLGCQWGLGLPLAYLLGPHLGLGLLGVWAAQVAYRTVQAGLLTVLWQRRSWSQVSV